MSEQYRGYARHVIVGLDETMKAQFEAAVAGSGLTISTYVRRALAAQFERDGVTPKRAKARTSEKRPAAAA